MKKQTAKKETVTTASTELPTLEELRQAEIEKEKQRFKLQNRIVKIIEKEGYFKASLYYEAIKKTKTIKVADTNLFSRQEILAAIKDVLLTHQPAN